MQAIVNQVLWPLIVVMVLATTLPSAADDFADAKQAFDAEQYRKAVRLLRPLAEKGDARAQHLLGRAHMFGLGAKRSDKQAQYWLMKAVAQDYAPAFSLLGRLLLEIDRSPARGLPLIKIAVRRGDPVAQAALGMLYLIGYPGIPVDMKESKRLLLLAVDQKYNGGYLGLAWWHASGQGKKPDYVELLKWIVIDTRIGTGATDLYRARALKHLNQAQIAEAKRRAAAWLKAHGETP
ncbi:MAG TPA: tetratricopeptide repeat protein [Alphaproteobacteria bacterium]|nr:tetratricopeptide repeat protein [Alphaproteobacteria bacterium]